MFKSKLSLPQYPTSSTLEDMIDETAKKFDKIFMQKDSRPYYKGEFIFFNVNREYKGITLPHPERFLHISSIEEKEEYTIFPCNNDLSYEICTNKCDETEALNIYKNIHRSECIYRLSRVHWIPEIINLANKRDPNITAWTKKDKDKNKNLIYKRYIRYECGIDDYIVILKEKRKRNVVKFYEFITAFPVFYKRNKKQYKEDFEKNL